MTIQAVGWALEQELPARPKLVLVAIANHADHTNGYCWLRADTIAKEASCSARAVFNFVGDLIRNGYLRKELRRGDDGKQRASDYWILFKREQIAWNSRPVEVAADEDDVVAETLDDDAETTTSCDPHALIACGTEATSEAPGPVDNAPGASGPHAPPCLRKDSDEPSKTNPEKKEPAHSFASPPRSYKPPPIAPEQPQGALHPDARKPVFVYRGTPAWDAWVAYKKRERGIDWTLSTTLTIEGERKTGWHFPTLFPPEQPASKESVEGRDATGPPSKKTA